MTADRETDKQAKPSFYRLTMTHGPMEMSFPSRLTQDDLDDLTALLDIIKRIASRTVVKDSTDG